MTWFRGSNVMAWTLIGCYPNTPLFIDRDIIDRIAWQAGAVILVVLEVDEINTIKAAKSHLRGNPDKALFILDAFLREIVEQAFIRRVVNKLQFLLLAEDTRAGTNDNP